MKIFIDPGHNYSGFDTGAQGNGLKEQDVTFEIADKLRELLISAGHEVKMSRNKITDSVGNTVTSSILERARFANEWNADLFISIHCNAFNTIVRGTETLVFSKKSQSFHIAEKIQSSIVNKLGTIDRGIKESPNLGVLWRTNMPSLLIETAFIDNPSDATLLRYRTNDFASAIYEGIVGYTQKCEKDTVLETVNDIVWELNHRGIMTDKELWLDKLKNDKNAYWLARKCVDYMRSNGV